MGRAEKRGRAYQGRVVVSWELRHRTWPWLEGGVKGLLGLGEWNPDRSEQTAKAKAECLLQA